MSVVLQNYIQNVLIRAEERLQCKEGAGCTADHLVLFQKFLKAESFRLQRLHREGMEGRVFCSALSGMMDLLILRCFEIANAVYARNQGPGSARLPLAVVATGGYGREELCPQSDIDLMVLCTDAHHPYVKAISEDLLYMLWDVGLKVGHAIRTPSECIHASLGDMQLRTSLMDARLIVGDQKLWEQFVLAYDRGVRGRAVEDYIRDRMEDREDRHRRLGMSIFIQEPHLKSGRGGLRDLQSLLWMVRVKFNVRSLEELMRLRYIDAQECRSLNHAYDFILRVRNELHFQSKCANDVLYLKFQPPVGRALGWTHPSRLRATEDFMRTYFQHARNMAQVTEELSERLAFRQLRIDSQRTTLRALLRPADRVKELVDGFRIQDETLFSCADNVFSEDPIRLLRVFRIAQQRQVTLSPELRRLIRGELGLIDRAFQRSQRASDVFLAILGQLGHVEPTLRMMHQTGVLGRYLPEFRGLNCLVQFEFYHRYTADEHTLQAIGVLDALYREAPPGHMIHGRMRSMLLDFSRPWLLYLALLFHDTGRGGRAKDHAVASRRLVERAMRRLRMPPQDRRVVQTLVEHHILMSRVSQLRDLSDPQTIVDFVQQVPTETMLRMLLLLTYADTVGTGAELWNDWRASLLWELHQKAEATLRGKTGEVLAGAQMKELRPVLVRKPPRGVSVEQVERHFERFHWRYFEVIEPKLLRVHLQMAAALEGGEQGPLIRTELCEEFGYTEVSVGMGDRPGLFSLISGSLAAAGMNILGARIFTRSDGLVLDVFNVVEVSGRPEIGSETLHRFSVLLKQALRGQVDLAAMAGRATGRKVRGLELAEMIHRPEVWINNEASLDRTVVEVRAEDRPGLLFVITDWIAKRGYDIDFSKISTQGRMVMDSFYIRGADGTKVPADELESMASSLSRTLYDWLGRSGYGSTMDRKQVEAHV